MKVEFTDQWGCQHSMSPAAAAEAIREVYDEWPGGLDEIESSQTQWKRIASILATFAHEAMMGAYRPKELPEKARMALMRSGLIELDRVVALTADRPVDS